MIIGAHNAWSYLKPKKWWMRLFYFTAQCQRCDIKEQYDKHNVRCFDLRIRFDKNDKPIICHGITEYEYSYEELLEDLRWLHNKGDVVIRILLELRSVPKKKWPTQKRAFNTFFHTVLKTFFPNFNYVEGRSLPDWDKILKNVRDGRETEDYASVSNPKYIDDWLPILYAWWHNKVARKKESDKDIMLLDFVDIY